ncbi:MAG: terminase family protein [Actinomycetota bacterium]
MAPDENRSLAQRLADMPSKQRTKVLAELTTAERESLPSQWSLWARAEQRPPPGDWRAWYIRGGRGSGKTRTAAETLAAWIRSAASLADGSGGEWAVIAPTYADARNTCIEGDSGLRKALGPEVAYWNRSLGELQTRSGATVFAATAEDGARRIQGKNLRGAWCDEVGLWRGDWEVAWHESLRFAVRVDPAKIVATGTPKGNVGLVAYLMADDRVVKTRLRTQDNADNLSAAVLRDLFESYGGSRLGRQELEGDVLDDLPGALWTRERIDRLRAHRHPDLRRIVVAIDPAVTSGGGSDETGIIVAGVGTDEHAYVLADYSCRLSPDGWAQRAVSAYRELAADRIVAEVNNGGDLVERVIRTVDAKVPYKAVRASRGKIVRAEPVSALYEQNKVHHVGFFPELEDQMCNFTPQSVQNSPDRLDAAVWALTHLMLEMQPRPRFRIASSALPARRPRRRPQRRRK